jgi:hypothetical protein
LPEFLGEFIFYGQVRLALMANPAGLKIIPV